jgi:hypothetical protein
MSVIVRPVVGLKFEHSRFLDRNWKPDRSLSETYQDAPHEVCQITKVTEQLVYYKALDGRGSSFTARASFPDVVRKVLMS